MTNPRQPPEKSHQVNQRAYKHQKTHRTVPSTENNHTQTRTQTRDQTKALKPDYFRGK